MSDIERLRRVEVRPAGRGVSIVHEVDEIHPNTESCDICHLLAPDNEPRFGSGWTMPYSGGPLYAPHAEEFTSADALIRRLGGTR